MAAGLKVSFVARAARGLGAVVRGCDRAGEALIVLLFAGIVIVGGMQVASRYLLNASLSWSEEFQRYGLIWIVFLALVVGYRRGAHIGMEILLARLPRTLRNAVGWLTDILWLVLGVAMVVFTAAYQSAAGLTFLQSVGRQSSAGMGLRMDIIYSCIVVAGAYLALAALHALLHRMAGEEPNKPAGDPD